MRACVRGCCVCVRARVCVFVRACMRACLCVCLLLFFSFGGGGGGSRETDILGYFTAVMICCQNEHGHLVSAPLI